MATKYYAVLTNVGAAKLANATALGAQVEITQMAVGDGNGVLPTPNPAQTALVHELRRKPLNSLSIDPNNANQIIAEQVIPEDEGGWWIREIGLFDKDGDMIAVANCAETYKPQLQEGSGRVQVVRMILIVSSTAAVTLKIDPSVVLATRQYVDDQIIQVKSYVDQKMAAHVAAADPHKQYAPKESPALTGRPTAPTAEGKDSSTQIANTAFVQAAIAALVGSSPEALDTLNELAAALGNDPNFATTVTNSLAGKMDKSANGSDIENVSVFLQNLGLSTVVRGDRCFLVGFASGEANQPYMTHFASQEVVKLATAESPTFTGAPLVPDALPGNYGQQAANTKFVHDKIAELVNSSPATLDTLKELADALGNDAHFATTMANALAGKQPKDQVLTDLSGKTVSGILAYFGLKTAAQKDVGTGPNQIPDMGGFTALLGDNGWAKLPSGLIFQWGIAGPLTPQNPDAVANFNITFPNKCLFITEHDQGNAAQKSVIQIGYVTTTGFTAYNLGVLDRKIPSGLQPPITASIPWFAIGY